MTDNQNVNKTSMKDVQQQHFLCKRASRVAEMFPKTSFSFCLFVRFFWNKRAICLFFCGMLEYTRNELNPGKPEINYLPYL